MGLVEARPPGKRALLTIPWCARAETKYRMQLVSVLRRVSLLAVLYRLQLVPGLRSHSLLGELYRLLLAELHRLQLVLVLRRVSFLSVLYRVQRNEEQDSSSYSSITHSLSISSFACSSVWNRSGFASKSTKQCGITSWSSSAPAARCTMVVRRCLSGLM